MVVAGHHEFRVEGRNLGLAWGPSFATHEGRRPHSTNTVGCDNARVAARQDGVDASPLRKSSAPPARRVQVLPSPLREVERRRWVLLPVWVVLLDRAARGPCTANTATKHVVVSGVARKPVSTQGRQHTGPSAHGAVSTQGTRRNATTRLTGQRPAPPRPLLHSSRHGCRGPQS